jgi:SulP family sulfate permease
MGVVKFIPLAVFSAILMSVAINMSRFPLFIKLSRFGIRDVIVLIATCVLTVVFDLTYGVIGGVILTFIVNAKNIKTGIKIEKVKDGEIKVKGTVFFLNANKLTDSIAKEFEICDNVTVHLEEVERIDETALEKIVTLNKKIKKQNKNLDLVGYNKKICQRLDKFFKVL